MKNNGLFEFARKYSFYISIGVLTLVLIIIFREKKLNEIFEEGKKSLASFYAENVRPLIYTNEITNEDVFNFAMFNSLPINKKDNKILFVSQNEEGKNSISIHTSEYKPNTNNYEEFSRYLGLNQTQKKEFDSLLTYHKARLYSSILSDTNNTFAVNQNIPLMRDLIYADIMQFANKMNYAKAKQIYAERKDVINPGDIKKVEQAFAKGIEPQDFLVLNNDSLYKAKLSTDIPKVTVARGEEDWRKQFDKSRIWSDEKRLQNIERNRELAMQYSPDRNKNDFRVYVPDVHVPKELARELSKLKNLPKLTQMVSVEPGRGDGKRPPIAFRMNFDFAKVDSMVARTMDAVMAFIPEEERAKVKKEIDSALAVTKAAREKQAQMRREEFRKMMSEREKKKSTDTTGKK